jgi:hypothetical protein
LPACDIGRTSCRIGLMPFSAASLSMALLKGSVSLSFVFELDDR